MLDFRYVNMNPKNRKTGDCSTRALSNILHDYMSYEDVLKKQCEVSLKCYFDITSKQVVERLLKEYGYVKMPQPRKPDGTKYKVCELDEIIPLDLREKGVLVTVAKHHTVIQGDYIEDTWNCGYKTVGNFYVKTRSGI